MTSEQSHGQAKPDDNMVHTGEVSGTDGSVYAEYGIPMMKPQSAAVRKVCSDAYLEHTLNSGIFSMATSDYLNGAKLAPDPSKSFEEGFSNQCSLASQSHDNLSDMYSRTVAMMNMGNYMETPGLMKFPYTGKRLDKPPKSERFCLVCGTKAQGYNFNAITCESCKAFFRRNAYKFNKLKCMFQGNCVIEIRTRRFCPFCRLKKCFDVGMKKEMILDEGERKARMQKMNSNKTRRRHSTPAPSCSAGSLDSSSIELIHIKEEPLSPQPPEMVSSTNEHVNRHQDIGSFVQPETRQSALYQHNKEHFHKASPESVFTNATNNPPKDPLLYRKMDVAEKETIADLAVSYESIMCSYVVDKEDPNNESSYTGVSEMVNQCEAAVIRLIKFSKSVVEFRELNKEDQIATLKSCVVSSLLLRSVSFYDEVNDGFRTPTGIIRTAVLKQAVGDPTYHDAYIAYCVSLKMLVKEDMTIISLMQVLLVFNPEADGLVDRYLVARLQERYLLLLKHQLEATYSFLNAQKVLACILQKITELQVVAEKHAEMLLQVDPKKIEPLLLEVLSIQ